MPGGPGRQRPGRSGADRGSPSTWSPRAAHGHEEPVAPGQLTGDASHVANLLAWLTSEDNGYVTSQVIYADDGAESARRPARV